MYARASSMGYGGQFNGLWWPVQWAFVASSMGYGGQFNGLWWPVQWAFVAFLVT